MSATTNDFATLTESAAFDFSVGAPESAIEKLQRALCIRTSLCDRKNTRKVSLQSATGYSQGEW